MRLDAILESLVNGEYSVINHDTNDMSDVNITLGSKQSYTKARGGDFITKSVLPCGPSPSVSHGLPYSTSKPNLSQGLAPTHNSHFSMDYRAEIAPSKKLPPVLNFGAPSVHYPVASPIDRPVVKTTNMFHDIDFHGCIPAGISAALPNDRPLPTVILKSVLTPPKGSRPRNVSRRVHFPEESQLVRCREFVSTDVIDISSFANATPTPLPQLAKQPPPKRRISIEQYRNTALTQATRTRLPVPFPTNEK